MAFLSALGRTAPGGADDLAKTDYGTTINDAKKNYDTATGGQNDLLARLLGVETGATPSLAEQQLQNATQRNAQANAAAVASQSGINPALAARQIQNTTAGLNQAEAGQAAENRIAEQNAARSLQAQILGGQASNDTNLYGAAAHEENAANATNVNNAALNLNAYKTDLGAAGSLLSGIGSTAVGAATGGLVPALGGMLAPKAPVPQLTPANPGAPNLYGNGVKTITLPGDAQTPGFAHGGDIDEEFLNAYKAAHGKDPRKSTEMLLAFHAGREHAANMTEGGEVGGPAPVVDGDSEANDQTPAMLSRGEHVVPASIADDPDNAGLMEALRKKERAAKAMRRAPVHLLGDA